MGIVDKDSVPEMPEPEVTYHQAWEHDWLYSAQRLVFFYTNRQGERQMIDVNRVGNEYIFNTADPIDDKLARATLGVLLRDAREKLGHE